jgi:hypothetical protein
VTVTTIEGEVDPLQVPLVSVTYQARLVAGTTYLAAVGRTAPVRVR